MRYRCDTKYPIILIHGLGFRDRKHLNYWGRIPEMLRENGALIFHGNQDSHGSIENNALQIKDTIETILKETGAEKVNLIAHSKGGLDARYALSVLKMEDQVASLTTIATPHHGSLAVDKILRLPDLFIRIVAFFSDCWYKILGDQMPDSYKVFKQFSTAFAIDFNNNTPDCQGVYYQSYAFIMNHMFSDIFMMIPYLFVKFIEGESDGLITPKSAAWTNFRGIVKSASNRGISHCDEVDMRRHRFTKLIKDSCISDITCFYIELIRHLKQCGF